MRLLAFRVFRVLCGSIWWEIQTKLLDRRAPEVPFILPLPDGPSAGFSGKIVAC